MVDFKKLDKLFVEDNLIQSTDNKDQISKRVKIMRTIKLLLPAFAAALAGILIIIPGMQKNEKEFSLNIPKPKAEEIEKLHMENTVFYITDNKNRVNNFVAKTVDETEPGSKLIKLNEPEGLLPTSDTNWITVNSPVGYYDQNKNLLWLDENVKMVFSDGMTATTQTVYYDATLSKAYSLSSVNGEGNFGTIQSKGFEYYKDKKILTFTGHTEIVIHQKNVEDKNK